MHACSSQDKHKTCVRSEIRDSVNVTIKNHIGLANEEEQRYGIDKWVAFFKIKTWEELKAMAATNQYMQSAADTIFELSSDENIRELCRRRAEYEADERHNARNIAIIAEQKSIIAQQKSDIAKKEPIIAQQKAEYEQLLVELRNLRESQRKTFD